jgi:hypothetical protein
LVVRTLRVEAAVNCAICERTLLVGERSMRFSPDGLRYVDVCPLCQDAALDQGWVKEGSPTTPAPAPIRRRRRLSLSAIFERAGAEPTPVADEPILRRLSREELIVVEAAELFNASSFRRTVSGISKSLGEARASVVPLSGPNTEAVITIAWELSWYRYRVTFESPQPVRLAERGHELSDLDPSFAEWNAQVERDGRVVPNIARL